MMAFNAAAREVCTVRTDETITPLQALTMMNNVTFVESARMLAERMMKQTDSPRDRIAWAFRVVTSRQPQAGELKLLLADLQVYQQEFTEHPEFATKFLAIGEKPYDKDLDAISLAIYSLVANTILNLDEAIIQN